MPRERRREPDWSNAPAPLATARERHRTRSEAEPDVDAPALDAPTSPSRGYGGGARRGRSAPPSSARATTAVAYLRRSTDRQEQSIPDQLRAIQAYCQRAGLQLLRCYTDDAISGTSTVGRRAFQQLIEDAQLPACDFGVIVCYDVKRFGRIDNDEAGYWRHLLRQHGVQVLYASENFSGDGTDDLLRPVKQWQAREESKDLSKVTIRGLLTKSTTGHWMGGAPPYGYDLQYESSTDQFLFILRYNADGSKLMFDRAGTLIRTLQRGETVGVSRKDHCKLIPSDKIRVSTVRRIFRLYVEDGIGFKGIADRLNRDGVPTARGPAWAGQYSGQWSLTTVRAILINPAYAGDCVWNRRTDARFHRIQGKGAVERKDVHARRLEDNDPSDWLVVKDAHPALVSRRTFEQARMRLEEKPASSSQRGIDPRTGLPKGRMDFRKVGDLSGPRSRFLLSKLVTCSRCGSRYEGYTQRRKALLPDGTREKVYQYACGAGIRHGKSVCTLGEVAQGDLEGAVIAAVLERYRRYAGEKGQKLLVRTIREELGLENRQVDDSRRRLTETLERIEETTRRLLDNITPGTRGMVERRLAELEKERAKGSRKLESIERLALTNAELKNLVEEATAFIESLPAALRHGPLERRCSVLRRCVTGASYDHAAREVSVSVRDLPAVGGVPEGGSTTGVVVPV